MEQILFALFALVACGGALAVVLSQNVVRMAFYLVVALGATAGLFFLLHADFVGATQLLIYVGGTVVLLIFGVMLTASSPYASLNTTTGELLQGAFLGAALLGVLITAVTGINWPETREKLAVAGPVGLPDGFNDENSGNTTRQLGTALMGLRLDDVAFNSQQETSTANVEAVAIASTDRLERPGYLLVFEIVSVHLLVVLIGAAYVARAKRRETPRDSVSAQEF